MGPTASGKSNLSLSIAREFDVEIVNVDAVQVYRGMDIGTAKPDAETRAEFPHHLLDIRDPDDVYSVADFREDAINAVDDIVSRGKIPLLVGGTMFYFSALTRGLSPLPPADASIREKITQEANAKGWPAMHAQLADVDPQSACKIDANDAQRIQRALEIFRLTGLPPSTAKLSAPPQPAGVNFVQICYSPSSREQLQQCIAARFEEMIAQGFVEEVRELAKRFDLTTALPASRAVGYRQILEHLQGSTEYDAMRLSAITATRRLAKRQLTWLRHYAGLVWFDSMAKSSRAAVLQYIHSKLTAMGYNRKGRWS